MVPNGIIWPNELNQKSCSSFSALHTIPGETKVSLFPVFSALLDFFSKKIPQRVTLQFVDVLRKMDVYESQTVSSFSFSALWHIFFETHVSPDVPAFILWCFATMDVEKCERVPLLSEPGARASGHLSRHFGRLGFSWVWYSFCEFDTLKFWTL